MYAASLLSLYHSRLIYGGLAGLCCWALYSDADCCVWWALCSCSLGQHLFIITIFATHLFIQLCSHPYATLCHGGLAGLGHQALHSGNDRFGGLCHWVLPLLGLLWLICGLFGRTSFCCTTFPPFFVPYGWSVVANLASVALPASALPQCIPHRITHDIVIPYQAAGFHALLLCALWHKPHQVFGFHAPPLEAQCYTMPGSMHCCCGHIVIPCRVAGFLALLWWAYCYAVPGCWVPCTAARWTLL